MTTTTEEDTPLTTTDPAVRELDRARRIGWARAYALQAEVAELESDHRDQRDQRKRAVGGAS